MNNKYIAYLNMALSIMYVILGGLYIDINHKYIGIGWLIVAAINALYTGILIGDIKDD